MLLTVGHMLDASGHAALGLSLLQSTVTGVNSDLNWYSGSLSLLPFVPAVMPSVDITCSNFSLTFFCLYIFHASWHQNSKKMKWKHLLHNPSVNHLINVSFLPFACLWIWDLGCCFMKLFPTAWHCMWRSMVNTGTVMWSSMVCVGTVMLSGMNDLNRWNQGDQTSECVLWYA